MPDEEEDEVADIRDVVESLINHWNSVIEGGDYSEDKIREIIEISGVPELEEGLDQMAAEEEEKEIDEEVDVTGTLRWTKADVHRIKILSEVVQVQKEEKAPKILLTELGEVTTEKVMLEAKANEIRISLDEAVVKSGALEGEIKDLQVIVARSYKSLQDQLVDVKVSCCLLVASCCCCCCCCYHCCYCCHCCHCCHCC